MHVQVHTPSLGAIPVEATFARCRSCSTPTPSEVATMKAVYCKTTSDNLVDILLRSNAFNNLISPGKYEWPSGKCMYN